MVDKESFSESTESNWIRKILHSRVLTSGSGRRLAVGILLVLLSTSLILGEKLSEIMATPLWDTFHRMKPRDPDGYFPVIIVDIDEKSLREHGRWPWPRWLTSELIARVAEQNPRSIGLDILMPEAEPSPLRFFDPGSPFYMELEKTLSKSPSNDEKLAQVLSDNSIVIGAALLPQTSDVDQSGKSQVVQDHTAFIEGSCQSSLELPKFSEITRNLPIFEQASFGQGFYNAFPDADSVVRKMPLVVRFGDRCLPSLALETFRAGLRPYSNWYHLQSEDGKNLDTIVLDQLDTQSQPDEQGLSETVDNKTTIETQEDGTIRPYFSKSYFNRRIPAHDVLTGSKSVSRLKNKTVLIGVTALGLTDVAAVPVSNKMDGVEIQAQVIENLISGTALQRPPTGYWIEIGILLIGGLLLIVLVPILPPVFASGIFLGCVLATVIGSYVAFINQILLDAVFPVSALGVVFVTLLNSVWAKSNLNRRKLAKTLLQEKLFHERIDGELNAARKIQLGSLPDTSRIENLPKSLQLASKLISAKEVGGDFYDAFMIDQDNLFFVVADVSGKGVPASLFMALSKALCKSAARRESDLSEIVREANTEISHENSGQLFITALMGILNGETGELRFCNAGHEHPLLLDKKNRVERLISDGGPPLCCLESYQYPVETVQMDSGDAIIIITDGVTDAIDLSGNAYGVQRLHQLMANRPSGSTISAMVAIIDDDVINYSAGVEQTDDITILGLSYML